MMNRNQLFHPLLAGMAALVLLGAGAAPGALAQGLTVATITVDGQPAQSVAGVQVRLPGAASGQAQTLFAGQAVAPGAELTLPRGARIELVSSNGNKITLHPGARFVAGVVTDRGESHQPLGGRVDFQVRKALDFFNIQYDRITAAVKGTDYSVEIDPAKSFKLTVTEGVVEVERQVQIRFAEAAGSATVTETTRSQGNSIRVAEDLKAGQSKTYRLDVEEYLAEFKNFGEAEAYFRKALAEAEASRRGVLTAVFNLVEVYWKIGKPRAMLELEGKCIEVAQVEFHSARCLLLGGNAHSDLGEFRRAIEYHERSLAIYERFYAESDQPDIATSLNNLGVSYGQLGEYGKAIEYFEKSLAIRERVFAGRDHADFVPSLINLSNVYGSLGEHRKEIEYLERALAMSERIFAGRDHPDIAGSLNNLGFAYTALGENRKAIEYHEKSLAMSERIFAGRDHQHIAESLTNLGVAYNELGEARKAIGYLEKSLSMFERVYAGHDHPAIAVSLNSAGGAYDSLGEHRKAIEYIEKSLAMRERVFAGRDHPDIARSLNNLGAAYDSLGEHRKAIDYYEKSLAIRERVFAGRDHPSIAQSLRNLANVHDKAGDALVAARYRERAAAMKDVNR